MALRGHASIQGSTDIPTLYDLLPGYLPMPQRARGASYDARGLHRAPSGSRRGWWANFDKYIVSLLKAWFGDAATRGERLRLRAALPKITGNHSHFPTMLRALDGGLDGLFVMGQNPAVGSQNAGLQRRALAQAEVAGRARPRRDRDRDVLARRARGRSRGELRTEDIETEVFLMPAAAHVEKDGHLHQHAAPGAVARQGARAARRRALASCGSCTTWPSACRRTTPARDGRARLADRQPRPGTTRATAPIGEPDAEAVLQRDQRLRRRRPASRVAGFAELKADGSTACGCWIYSRRLRRRRQPGAPPRARRRRRPEAAGSRPSGAGRGRPTAACSTTAPRPTRRASRGRERKTLRLVGRGAGEVDRLRRARLPGRQAARLPRAGRTPRAWTRSAATDPFIMMADGTRLAVRADRPARRPAADALRAGRVAGARTCSTPSIGATRRR